MTRDLDIRLTPLEAATSTSNKQIRQALLYLSVVVMEAGGKATLTITVQKKRMRNK